MTATSDSSFTNPPASTGSSSENPALSAPALPAITSTEAATLASSKASTSTDHTQHTQDDTRRQPSSSTSTASELASTKIILLDALRRFPDFPIPGINFIDILPLFQDPAIHNALLRALELQVLTFAASASSSADIDATTATPPVKPDVIVGLDARGFLFGPSLALRLNASFVPVRKKGKLPGPCVTAAFEKEYGTDFFQMQEDAIKPGQKVLVVDDIIATGGSAAAAGSLVKQLGGNLIGYLFILEIPFLKGRDKLGGLPTATLLETDD